MSGRSIKPLAFTFGLLLLMGCSYLGIDMGKGPAQAQQAADCLVRVWVDGKEAPCVEGWREIKQPVDTDLKLKYEIPHPEKMGDVKSVMINIFPDFNGQPSGQADFIVFATDTNNPDAQMKAGKLYDLSKKIEELTYMDENSKRVDGIKLKPGTKYYMNFVVSADRSETASVVFTTK
ncbi:MAG: hypothetical protein JSV78_07530 [Phycisphaerales bacterium]|nr:MAG: hypothetical protein JSV78_07530 [Phycisphaerales bacterium]